ncbi:MAG: methylated-DNA--[protein]-cysteine S-methyltransferase [Ferrovibrio sp.]|uniref:methylated-DNA--[protein]-cysteine S-methyltransferase n=1 Tax=Ferrovibrio sp. TaxID=1917215 RepID=UPI00262FB945|nr:methylated-DNA--[protein]-cysteine S-methyltransferase [Ferrovibrio sp.]MCW0236007.1 methylated-DNA--[protein]-cysteine S-methyltransferase [Ferrovibrio sp.]
MSKNRATYSLTLSSPLGSLTVTATTAAVVKLDWGGRGAQKASWAADIDTPPEAGALLAEAARQLEVYFTDGRFRFDLPLEPAGTDFQRAVWDFMLAIPAGRTRSYGEAATAIGSGPVDSRAVGSACGANPIPVIIPCHRILAAGGDAGGYSGKGGLDTKRWLLRHEGAYVPSEQVSLF